MEDVVGEDLETCGTETAVGVNCAISKFTTGILLGLSIRSKFLTSLFFGQEQPGPRMIESLATGEITICDINRKFVLQDRTFYVPLTADPHHFVSHLFIIFLIKR
jgi:hypothetical protein